MKMLKTLAAFALPSLFLVGCGLGDVINGALDGGSTGDGGSTNLFKLCTQTYNTYDAQVVNDGCTDGLMMSAFLRDRYVRVNNTNGTVTVLSADQMTQLGTGTILFNMNQGSFTYMQDNVSDGTCRFTTSRTGSLTVTADYDFTLNLTDTKTNFQSEMGQMCRKTNGCQNNFVLKLRKPTTSACITM